MLSSRYKNKVLVYNYISIEYKYTYLKFSQIGYSGRQSRYMTSLAIQLLQLHVYTYVTVIIDYSVNNQIVND